MGMLLLLFSCCHLFMCQIGASILGFPPPNCADTSSTFCHFSVFLASASIFGALEGSASSPAPLTFELQVSVGAPCDEALYRSLNILWVWTDITGKCQAAHHKEVIHLYYWWLNWLMFNLLIKMRHKWSAAYIFLCTIYNCFAHHY